MNYETYLKTERAKYSEFSAAVRSILESAIEKEEYLRLQQIQARAKDPTSLWKKLEARKLTETIALERDIKDLAGCRIIFYTNDDVSNFERSGIIHLNFHVDWDRTKFHYPIPESTKPGELFIGINYVVKLKENRGSLPEYARFKDLWCEVQVQTILNHAWSETAHDLIYKPLECEGFGSKLRKVIKDRLHAVMKDHLLPAGYELQKALSDYGILQTGVRLLEEGGLSALSTCKDNNERYDIIKGFGEYVIPNFDDVAPLYDGIIEHLLPAVERARSTEYKAREIAGVSYWGINSDQVIEAATRILEFVRYIDVEKTFDAVTKIFSGAQTERERKVIMGLVEHLAEHNLKAWEQVGPRIQMILMRKISDLDAKKREVIRPVVSKVIGEALKIDIQGTNADFDRVEFIRGQVRCTKELLQMRALAIEIAKEQYLAAATLDEKREALSTLFSATAAAALADTSDALLLAIARDSVNVTEFCRMLTEKESYEIYQVIESRCLRMFERNVGIRAQKAQNLELMTACDDLDKIILTIRDALDANLDYLVFKSLVGFESVFPPTWAEGRAAGEAWRVKFLEEQISAINTSTSGTWLARIQRCAKTTTNDGATFIHFRQFLEALARALPHIALRYLDQLDAVTERFLSSLLVGLSQSVESENASKKMAEWINEGRYLRELAWYLRSAPEVDLNQLQQIIEWGITRNDKAIIVPGMAVCIAKYAEKSESLLTSAFLRGLKHMRDHRDSSWVYEAWYHNRAKSFFGSLSLGGAELTLDGLKFIGEIDHSSEYVLAYIGASYPKLVFDFFGKRISYAKETQVPQKYEAIPFDLNEVDATLQEIPEYAIDKAREWYIADASMQHYAVKLLHNAFPSFPEAFEKKLLLVAASGALEDLKFVVEVLRSYEGVEAIWNACKELVNALPMEDDLLGAVEIALVSTEGTSGTFGLVQAYQEKKQRISQWLDDPREKVRLFAEKFVLALERDIAAEQRRAEEGLEMRKRGFDSIARAVD